MKALQRGGEVRALARRVFPMSKVRPAACKSPVSMWYYNTVRYVNTSCGSDDLFPLYPRLSEGA